MRRRTALKSIFCGAALGIPSLTGKQGFLPTLIPDAEIEQSEHKAMASVAEDFRRRFDVPALSVAITQNGRLAYQRAFGVPRRDSQEELRTSHLFRIASVTKPITSTAIFSLIEKGRLRSEDTLFGKYGILGTEYGRQPYGRGVEQITIDHLLTHTSGGWGNGPNDPMFSNPGMHHAELISWTLNNQPLNNLPGRVFDYSNFGYCILGRVIEQITRQSYSDYVQSTILSPCGITDMRIAGNTLKDRAAGEVTYYGQNGQDPYGMNVTRMDSHGGWLATSGDLVRFATHVDGFDIRRNILKPETIRRMTAPGEINANYARGWKVNTKNHWWHGGGLPGTTTILVRTSSHLCWAALTNTRREPAEEIDVALDDMVWDMVRKVSAWRST
jgi:CubicO group peptidase (beta-lactamase class C family)